MRLERNKRELGQRPIWFYWDPRMEVKNTESIPSRHRSAIVASRVPFTAPRSVRGKKSTSPLRVERAEFCFPTRSVVVQRVPRRFRVERPRVLYDAGAGRGTKEYLAAPHRASEFFSDAEVVVAKECSAAQHRASEVLSRRGALRDSK